MTKQISKEMDGRIPLTRARELELGETIQKYKSGKKRDVAISELASNNLQLVASEAQKYSTRCSVSFEDLYSAGKVGLIRAANAYDPNRFKTKFSTYAIFWIRQGIYDQIRISSPVHIPMHIITQNSKVNKQIDQDATLTDSQLCDIFQVSKCKMDRIQMANVSSVSIDAPIKEGEEGATLGDFLPYGGLLPGDEGIDDPRYEFLKESLGELDEMSRDILFSQILSETKIKLNDLGKKYNVSAECIRQKRNKALALLKKKIQFKMGVKGAI